MAWVGGVTDDNNTDHVRQTCEHIIDRSAHVELPTAVGVGRADEQQARRDLTESIDHPRGSEIRRRSADDSTDG